jgi:excisionase family DNA binding protein
MSGPTLVVAEAAAYLRVSEDWLRREASAGRVPSHKIGRSRRFIQKELDDYIAACTYRAADALAQSPASRQRRRRAS